MPRVGCWPLPWCWKGGRGKQPRRPARWSGRRCATGCIATMSWGWRACSTGPAAMVHSLACRTSNEPRWRNGSNRDPTLSGMASSVGAASICNSGYCRSSPSLCTSAQWASCCASCHSAGYRCVRSIRKARPRITRFSAQFPRSHDCGLAAGSGRQAGGGLVYGRGSRRSAGDVDPRVGAAWLTSPRPARSAVRMGLFVRAVCPERSTGAAIIMPEVNVEAMNEHLAEISRRVSVGAIALLVLDGAGWHSSPRLKVPDNIALLPLPPYSPELNPVENVWEFLRGNWLSHRVCDTYEAILDACQHAWNEPMQSPERIASLTTRLWAKPVTE